MTGFHVGPSEQWQPIALRLAFRAVPVPPELPAISPANQVLWVPPSPGAIRSVVLFEDDGDPVVAAGGATVLRLGLNGSTTSIGSLFVPSQTIATLNVGQVGGWGIRGAADPGGVNATNPNGSGGVVMIGEGQADGTSPADDTRGLAISSDAGTVTGVLFVLFEFRAIRWF